MKIGIMSDSHENKEKIIAALNVFNSENVELILHAGDIISPIMCSAFKLSRSKMIFVYGNNDGEKILLKQKIEELGFSIFTGKYEFEFSGKKIILMHEPDGLAGFVKSDYYDIIVYGHTHKIDIRTGKPFVINPGEISGLITGDSTCCILDLNSMQNLLIKL